MSLVILNLPALYCETFPIKKKGGGGEQYKFSHLIIKELDDILLI